MSQLSSAHILCHLLPATLLETGSSAWSTCPAQQRWVSVWTQLRNWSQWRLRIQCLELKLWGTSEMERLKILIVAKLKGWNSCEKGIYYWDIIGTSMNFQKRFQSANSHQFTNITYVISVYFCNVLINILPAPYVPHLRQACWFPPVLLPPEGIEAKSRFHNAEAFRSGSCDSGKHQTIQKQIGHLLTPRSY